MAKTNVRPYAFTPELQRLLVTCVSSSQRAYGKIGFALEIEAMSDPMSQLALKAARAIASETKRGPDSIILVTQRIRRWVEEGKQSYEDFLAVSELFEAVETVGFDEDALIKEAAPVLKRRKQRKVLDEAQEAYAKREESFEETLGGLQQVAQIGAADVSLGSRLDAASIDQMAAVQLAERLSTGIGDLDVAIDGGLARGLVGVGLGDTSSGKSMFLAHQTVTAMLASRNTIYFSLELPQHIIDARVFANLSGIPTNDILSDAKVRTGAARKALEYVRDLYQVSNAGYYICKAFDDGTELGVLLEHVDRVEQELGSADLVVIDYFDCIGKPGKSTYEHGRAVMGELCNWTDQHRCWTWTVSQAIRPSTKRGGKRAKKPGEVAEVQVDLADVADSYNRVRRPPLVITFNPADDGMGYFVAKNTMGVRGAFISSIPTDFACARMVPGSRGVTPNRPVSRPVAEQSPF